MQNRKYDAANDTYLESCLRVPRLGVRADTDFVPRLLPTRSRYRPPTRMLLNRSYTHKLDVDMSVEMQPAWTATTASYPRQ